MYCEPGVFTYFDKKSLNKIIYDDKNRIIFIDGEDNTIINPIHKYGNPYFKRELIFSIENVFPISFAIPTCKVNFNKNKNFMNAYIIYY